MALPPNASLTVVVVVYAAGEAIHATVDAVQRDTSYPHRTVLLHNVSPEVTADELRSWPGEHEVWELPENIGYAGAINYALDHAESDVVGIWNDDAAPEPGALGAMMAGFGRSDRISAVTASIINAGEAEEARNGTLNLAGRIIPERFSDRTHVLYPSGAAMLLRRDLSFRADADYFLYYEDVYLGLTARLAGYHPVMVPEAKVRHGHHASMHTIASDELEFLRERNRLQTLWTIFSDATLDKLHGYWKQEREMLRLGALVGRNKLQAVRRAEEWMKANEAAVMAKREAVQATRVVDDEALLAHFSYRLLAPSVPGATVFNNRAKAYCEKSGLLTWDLREESQGKYALPDLGDGA